MTKEDLRKKIEEIELSAAMKKRAVYIQFVKDNAKYKVGDIVADSTETIRVECISYHIARDFDVSIYYYGPLLTKKGEPRKDGSKRAVFESAIKK